MALAFSGAEASAVAITASDPTGLAYVSDGRIKTSEDAHEAWHANRDRSPTSGFGIGGRRSAARRWAGATPP